MKICHCTLPCFNPEACKYCGNTEFEGLNDDIKWYTTTNPSLNKISITIDLKLEDLKKLIRELNNNA